MPGRRGPDENDWPDWLISMRQYPTGWDWGLAVWATPLRRILVACFLLLGAILMIADLLSTGEDDGSFGTFVKLAVGPMTAVAMLFVLAQAVRDLVQRENRPPWPFFTHLEGVSNRVQVAWIALYLACIWVLYDANW